MPLFYQHNINEFSRLGIWNIAETEDFFLEKVFLQREISHPHKRLQHLAGRYLLQLLFSDFPYDLIMIADTRKPFLINEAYHFSISHCGDFAAAIVSRKSRVGIDIELVKPMIQKIRSKFLSNAEMQLLSESEVISGEVIPKINNVPSQSPSSGFLTLCWSAKEALYKWFGSGGVDFKAHMQLSKPIDFKSGEFIRSSYTFSKTEQVHLVVMSKTFNEMVMSYVLS